MALRHFQCQCTKLKTGLNMSKYIIELISQSMTIILKSEGRNATSVAIQLVFNTQEVLIQL